MHHGFLGVLRVQLGAGVAVSVGHDEDGGLVPPVEHQHQQHVPHLVAGAHVVQLTWREARQEFSLSE